MTYCDSALTKRGLEQMTALVLMQAGNAAVLARQPGWIRWFASLCSGGPVDAHALQATVRSSVTHRPPVWQPDDKAEILKLAVNLIVSVLYHRFVNPPEPPLPPLPGAKPPAVPRTTISHTQHSAQHMPARDATGH
jgi:hypothetical protein